MSVYDEVTQAIIAELEQGVPPWVKSWQSHLPRNFISRKEYRGVNVILLWVVANKKGYRSPYWLTFKQAGELKGKIRKGEKATGIVYAATAATTQVLVNLYAKQDISFTFNLLQTKPVPHSCNGDRA